MKTALLLLSFSALLAAAGDSVLVFSAESLSHKAFAPGDTATVRFTLDIRKPWHIYAHEIKDEFLIPSRLELKGEGIDLVGVDYPRGEERTFMEITDFLYEGKVTFPARVRVAKRGPKKLEARFHYQACNDRICLPPAAKTVSLEIP